MTVVSLRRGPGMPGLETSWRPWGCASAAVTRISPRANAATLTTNSQFPTSCVDSPARLTNFSHMEQRCLARNRGEDRTILRALVCAHIGETVGIGGNPGVICVKSYR